MAALTSMTTQRWLACLTVLAMLELVTATSCFAQEHPEHPKKPAAGKASKQEHPKEGPKVTFTVDDMAAAIQDYVKRDSELKGGYFLVYDSTANAPLALKLDKVHRERLSQISDDVVFVCADFTDTTGKTYDLDIFMKGPDKDHLTVTDVSIHKEAGSPRYTWQEKDGRWTKKPN